METNTPHEGLIAAFDAGTEEINRHIITFRTAVATRDIQIIADNTHNLFIATAYIVGMAHAVGLSREDFYAHVEKCFNT